MHDFKKIETSVLLVMLAAYSSDYGRELSDCETIDCNLTIDRLREEIAARKIDGNSHPRTSVGQK
jgi:hypothetical protein